MVACKTSKNPETKKEQEIVATLDLVNVENDQVQVTINPGKISKDQLTFLIPKTIPGTYSIDNYGQFVENLKALDYDGNEIPVNRLNENTWSISNPSEFDKLTYLVNDTYDIEGEKGVFSPAGTNINEGENFMLNLHGFVGYFENMDQQPYLLKIERPEGLIPGTALEMANKEPMNNDNNYVVDVFPASRYFEIIDHPIMYAEPDTASFTIDGMKVLIDVYSPNDIHSADAIKPVIQDMVNAQKDFLGEIDNTDKYSILLYLSDLQGADAKGFGALEHHTSTTVVLPETMDVNSLSKTMTDVVSHEFFHILTPLNIHSKEIHYFDYNDPEMSQHLWMYEGVTEYFANLFQINQGLIDKDDFYNRISEKIETSRGFDDTVPFTVMSENILKDPYKDMYYNVYQKGALIGMALDIRLRELSNGQMGLLDLMKKLSEKYGKNKPFEDEELIPTIISLTYPEIQDFFDQYITGTTPIPYDEFFEKVGINMKKEKVEVGYFLKGQVPYIDVNQETGEIFFRNTPLNTFLKDLGIQGGDVLKSVNGTTYDINNIYNLVSSSMQWKTGEDIVFTIVRDGEEIELSGKITKPYALNTSLVEMDLPENNPKVVLRQSWLKG